jgi:hypothetical protein
MSATFTQVAVVVRSVIFESSFNGRLSLAKTGAVVPFYYMADGGGRRIAALPSTGLDILISRDKH